MLRRLRLANGKAPMTLMTRVTDSKYTDHCMGVAVAHTVILTAAPLGAYRGYPPDLRTTLLLLQVLMPYMHLSQELAYGLYISCCATVLPVLLRQPSGKS